LHSLGVFFAVAWTVYLAVETCDHCTVLGWVKQTIKFGSTIG